MLIHVLVSEEVRTVLPGFIAEWCPVCDGPRAIRVERRERRTKTFFIPITAWKKKAEKCTCTGCRTRLEVDTGPSPRLSGTDSPLDSVVAITNPSLASQAARHRELHAKAGRGSLSVAEREELITAALRRASLLVRARGWKKSLSEAITITLLSLIVGPFVAMLTVFIPVMAATEPRGPSPQTEAILKWVLVGSAPLMAALTLWFRHLYFARQRWRGCAAAGKMVSTLNSTADELAAAAFAERSAGNRLCRGSGEQIARRMLRAGSAAPFAPAQLAA